MPPAGARSGEAHGSASREGNPVPSGGRRVGFVAALFYPLRGASFVYIRHPGLIRIWIFPILLTVLALGGLVWGATVLGPDLVEALVAAPPQDDDGLGLVLLRLLYGTAEVMAGLVVGLVGLLLVVVLLPVLAAPFNDALSEAVERLATGRGAPPFSLGKLVRDVVRSLGYELGKLFIWLAAILPLLLLSLPFPVLGPVVGPASLGITWLFLGLDYVDWPAARRDATLGDRVETVKKHVRPLVGLGIGVWFLVHVPFVNLLFMPAAVAGGTLLFLDLDGGSSSPDPPG
jgi:CysZ protein